MSAPEVMLCTWDGEAFAPLARHQKAADARYVIGERYFIEVREQRSEASHRAFMATVTEAWRSLPEDQAERFPSPDALRRYALIKCGFCTKRDIVCANNGEAVRLAAMFNGMDPYSLTLVSERAVSVWTAESQSYRSMGKQRFNESQSAVRDYIASLLEVRPDELPEVEAA